jgi:hypothetical protein
MRMVHARTEAPCRAGDTALAFGSRATPPPPPTLTQPGGSAGAGPERDPALRQLQLHPGLLALRGSSGPVLAALKSGMQAETAANPALAGAHGSRA